MLQFDINSFFSRDSLIRTLANMPVLSSPVLDSQKEDVTTHSPQ